MQAIKTVGIIGTGNLAWNLVGNFAGTSYSVEQVIGRSQDKLDKLVQEFSIPLSSTDLQELHPDLDFVFIAVNDLQIQEVAKQIAESKSEKSIYVHGSGSVAIQSLEQLGENAAVMWPIQTLTTDKVADLKEVPLFIEGTDASRDAIRTLAKQLSEKVIYTDSEQRRIAHLAAVITGNFPNLLYAIAEKITSQIPDVDLQTFAPLIRETLNKSIEFGPGNAQTGPAKRGDKATMEEHMEMLGKIDGDFAEVYRVISELIGKA